MLYTTTRNNVDTFTAQRTLSTKRAPDGGLFMPYHLPVYSWSELCRISNLKFNSRIAEILNVLFGVHLSDYDLDLTVGRYSVRLQQLGQRIMTAECWHNPQWEFSGMVKDLAHLIISDKEMEAELTGWADIGIRIAVLFGIFGELIHNDYAAQDKPVDLSVVAGTFSAPMAAWYARGMGLPIGNIVCCCNENGALWDFICHGQLRTDGIACRTIIPEADILVPEGLEYLISLYSGPDDAEFFAKCYREGNTYYIDESLLSRLRKGIYATVSSERRVLSTMSGVYSAHQYVMAPSSALAYAGLQDYRARSGISRMALIMADRSPRLELDVITDVIGISVKEIEKQL